MIRCGKTNYKLAFWLLISLWYSPQFIEFGWPYIFWLVTTIYDQHSKPLVLRLWPWFRAMASTVVLAKSSTWPIEFTCWSGQIFQFNGRCGIYFYPGEKWNIILYRKDVGLFCSAKLCSIIKRTHFLWAVRDYMCYFQKNKSQVQKPILRIN